MVVAGELRLVFIGDGVVRNWLANDAAVISEKPDAEDTADKLFEKIEAGREQAELGDWKSAPSSGLVARLRKG